MALSIGKTGISASFAAKRSISGSGSGSDVGMMGITSQRMQP